MSHPLHARPLCRAEDLGASIPDSPHAVSVCLPAWADVIGYEEKDPRVISRMRTGYPRFFIHPLVNEVRCALAPGAGEDVLPFHDREAAAECASLTGGRAAETDGLWAAFFANGASATALAYWQHAGRIMSSRAAEDWLATRKLASPDPALEEVMLSRLAGWSGAPPRCISFHPSGMAAIFAAFRLATARRPGKRTVMFGFPYTDTLKILEKFGAGTLFLPRGDKEDLAHLRSALENEEIAGIFCEFPGNPLLNTPDLPAIRDIAAAHGVPVVVDDTIGTFFNVDVLPYADIVATSLTKAVSGEGDVMAGALTVNPRGIFGERPPDTQSGGIYMRDLQALEKNSRDFEERMKTANANALELARFLRPHPAVERVWYPGLDPSPVYAQLAKPGGGFGAVVSFLPRDAAANSPRIYEQLAVSRGISLGASYTLVCPYVQLAHYHELDWAARCGIDPNLLRVAVGTESWDDLRKRFADALGK
ncbi:MAG: PLP-dependent transferase [Chthoniobacterales bacterium]|nr:PLP-dependent transferase [Chthoniobacterales bacterium]